MPDCCAGTCSAASVTSRDCAPPVCSPPPSTPGCAPGCARRRSRSTRPAARRPRQEDVHTAIEEWLTRRLPGVGERLHTGRSRNDQVATRSPAVPQGPAARAARRRARAGRGAARLRRAPSHRALAGLHAPAPGDAVVGRPLGRGVRRRACSTPPRRSSGSGPAVDRSPLGSAAGYGVPLPLKREAAARALGFGGARPQRRHGARRAGEARGRRALLVHSAGPRARDGCRRTSSCSAPRSTGT